MIEIDDKVNKLSIVTDENRLKQILFNFNSNALKFTKSGFIKLKAKYITKSSFIEISVKDSGMGRKRDQHNLIFKENVQLNVEKEYNSKGSVLGLLITKSRADLLNHEIGFYLKLGEGSKFYLRMESANLNEDLILKSNKMSFKFPNYINLSSSETNRELFKQSKKYYS